MPSRFDVISPRATCRSTATWKTWTFSYRYMYQRTSSQSGGPSVRHYVHTSFSHIFSIELRVNEIIYVYICIALSPFGYLPAGQVPQTGDLYRVLLSRVQSKIIPKQMSIGNSFVQCLGAVSFSYQSLILRMFQGETNSTGTDWNLTYNYSKAIDFMDDRPAYYDSSSFNSNYEDYLEVSTPVFHVFPSFDPWVSWSISFFRSFVSLSFHFVCCDLSVFKNLIKNARGSH